MPVNYAQYAVDPMNSMLKAASLGQQIVSARGQQQAQMAAGQQAQQQLAAEKSKQSRIDQASQIYAALNANQPEIAQKLIGDYAAAYDNAGSLEESKNIKVLGQLIDKSPETAKASVLYSLASATAPDKFVELWDKLQARSMAQAKLPGELQQQAAQLGLTRAQTKEIETRTQKLSGETAKLALEMEALQSGSPQVVADPKKRFDMERALAGDYKKRASSLDASTRNLEIIQASAADDSGAGDIALVTSFMKMLDPGSVVRETEFATARDTAGLYTMMQNWATKKTTGAFLSPGQRKNFAELSRKYMEAAEREDKRVRDDMGFMIKNYGLEKQNVFGTRAGKGAPEAQAMAPVQVMQKADAIIGGR